MSRVSTFLLLVGLMLIVSVVPAGAGVENNPNAFVGQDVSCDNGLKLDTLVAVGQAGHDGENPGVAGVALYAEIANLPGAEDPVPIFGSLPLNPGLAKVTTWCTWQGDGLLFQGWVRVRPGAAD